MAFKREPLHSGNSSITSRKKPSRGSSISNWNIWLFGLCFSMLSLLAVPVYKFFRLEEYTIFYFFVDVFGSIGICTITASMAIAAAFEDIAARGINNKPWIGLILIAVTCYIVYGAIAHDPVEQNTLLLHRIVPTNILLFIAMFTLSLRSFKSLPKFKICKFFKKG